MEKFLVGKHVSAYVRLLFLLHIFAHIIARYIEEEYI